MGETNWNTITPDTLFAGKAGIESLLNTGSENGTHWIPGEVDTSIRPGWFYHAKEDSLVKSPQKLFDIYLTSVGRGSTLLLNVPPDRRGVFHENDVKSLQGFRELLNKEFNANLARKARVEASSYRDNSSAFEPKNVTDSNPETYWSTDDNVTTGALTVDLGSQKTVKYIVLQEYIKLGQRVQSFDIEIWKDSKWQIAGSGTTVGYKRIIKIDPTLTNKIRVKITSSKASPVISALEVF